MQISLVLLFLGLFCLLLPAGCGLSNSHVVRKKGPRPQMRTDRVAFGHLVDEFERQGTKRRGIPMNTRHIPITFGHPENPRHQASCTIYRNDQRAIIIRRKWWDSASPSSRESLFNHELGHCYLGREEHDCTILPDGFKKSLMHEEIVSGDRYRARRDYYLDELFNASSHNPSRGCNP